MNVKKVKMSQDALYKYLTDHDVKIIRIAELMGKSPAVVNSDFLHHKSSKGKSRCFSVENVKLLNEALHKFSDELIARLVVFGSEQMYTNKHGRTYDPGMIEPLNKLGEFLNMTGIFGRILGWNKYKKLNVFASKTSKNYGNISEQDVIMINSEILSIAGVLAGVEVVPDENAYDDSNSSKA